MYFISNKVHLRYYIDVEEIIFCMGRNKPLWVTLFKIVWSPNKQ